MERRVRTSGKSTNHATAGAQKKPVSRARPKPESTRSSGADSCTQGAKKSASPATAKTRRSARLRPEYVHGSVSMWGGSGSSGYSSAASYEGGSLPRSLRSRPQSGQAEASPGSKS